MGGGPFTYLTDAVLRAPTIGSMLMCVAAALVGVIVFLRRQSLLGEALSHAAYPGVILGVILAAGFDFDENQRLTLSVFIVAGAFISGMAGLWAIHLLQQRFKIRSDSALCFVLSTFFGLGITLASQVQFTHTALYRQVNVYLYGQAATMTDIHILIYGILAAIVAAVIIILYKELQAMTFDRGYAKTIGMPTGPIDGIFFALIVAAVVIGIRSVGVVLMSAMLIAPAAAARQYTNRLSRMLMLAAFFGMISGFLGNYFSVEGSSLLHDYYPDSRVALPTGPTIVTVASLICLGSLLFAPERGLLWRALRIARFRHQCLLENILKSLWRFGPHKEMHFDEIKRYQTISDAYLHLLLFLLRHQGWIDKVENEKAYRLTREGEARAANIVRLHRLWEVYLADYIGIGVEKVHRSAEEMEHIINPDLEKELTQLLDNPKRDPHHQPIPPREGG